MRQSHNQDTACEKKRLFSIKMKKREKERKSMSFSRVASRITKMKQFQSIWS